MMPVVAAAGGSGMGGGKKPFAAFLAYPGDSNRRRRVRTWRMRLKWSVSYLN
jgi:hypothetical protein